MFQIRAPRPLAADAARGAAGAVDILGYPVSSADAPECAAQVAEWLARGARLRWAACINPHSYAVASELPSFRAALLGADWLLPDGAGIVLAARLLGRPIRRRVTGSDLFDELHRIGGASPRGLSVFLLGSTEQTLARVRERLTREHPGVRVAGTYAPPFAPAFTEEENEAMVRAVNAAQADVLWVSMTAPKQELWIHQHRDRLNVRFAAAVGAVFDFYVGNVKRSHPLAQRLGLEWLPRLLREPRRLWRRTFVSAPRFLRDTLRARLRGGAAPGAPRVTAGDASPESRPDVVIAIPVLLNGGTEVQTLSLARALVGSHRVTVCCYHEHDRAMAERFRAVGAEVVLLGWSRARPLWRFVLALRKVLASWGPDVVHVQYLAPGLAAVLAARLARVPIVLTTMHVPGYGLHVRVFVRIARLLSDAFICVSENLERFWCGTPARLRAGAASRHQTIRNCVDVERLRAAARDTDRARVRAELGLEDAPTIGVVGRLRSEKGQGTMLAALPRVLREVPAAKLVVVGDGPDRGALERLAAELGVAASVRWTGHVAPERVPELYTAMDVLVVPSRYEAFGLVAAEAMAMSLPVVGTATAGLSEVIAAGDTGLLVPPADPGALADAVLELLRDPARARAMGARGSERAGECFSRERYEREILATYARLRGSRRAP